MARGGTDTAKRIVARTPLTELWNANGLLDARRAENVGQAEIAQLLRDGSIFVIAEVGNPLRWISGDDRFPFWKEEVKGRLVAADAGGFHLDDYPATTAMSR